MFTAMFIIHCRHSMHVGHCWIDLSELDSVMSVQGHDITWPLDIVQLIFVLHVSELRTIKDLPHLLREWLAARLSPSAELASATIPS